MGLASDDDQTGGDVILAVTLQELRDRHPLLVRELAGRWEQGLRGLLGVAGASGLIGAPIAADRLSSATQTVVGVLLSGVLLTAVVGLALVMSAAYGSARLFNPATATELHAERRHLADQALNRLRWGRALAIAAVALLAGTVAIAWIDPGADKTLRLQVETTTGITHCGKLLDAPDNTIALHTDTEGRVEIAADTITAIATTSSCDEATP